MIERALTAVVISQYRRKIAEKHKINLKPVILFKSNRVNSPKNKEETRGSNPKVVVSSDFKEKFHKLISNLKVEDLNNLKKIKNTVLNKAFDFFKDNEISLENLVGELKSDFSQERCLTVDDDKELEKKQLLLNYVTYLFPLHQLVIQFYKIHLMPSSVSPLTFIIYCYLF